MYVVQRVFGVGGDVGLDVDHGRADELGDDFQDGRLGLEDLGMPFEIALQLGTLLGAGAPVGRRQRRNAGHCAWTSSANCTRGPRRA